MSRRSRPAEVDPSLILELQAGVAGMRKRGEKAVDPERNSRDRASDATSEPFREDMPRVGGRPNRATTGRSRRENRSPRSCLSVPIAVGEHTRRLTMAITVFEGSETTYGDTLTRALELLESDLRSQGAQIPDFVKRKPGRRGSQ